MANETFCIRPATKADVAAMAKVNIDTRRATHARFFPAQLMERMSYERSAERLHISIWEDAQPGEKIALVAENSTGQVVGMLVGGAVRDPDPEYRSEIYVLYVLPQYHRQGIGRRMVAKAVESLLAINPTNLLIWVLADNQPSRRFYEAIGGVAVREKEVDFDGIWLKEVGYGWSDARVLLQEPP